MALTAASDLEAGEMMLIGAWCRDILHRGLGHTFPTTATRDLDIALALSTWDAYRTLAAACSPASGRQGSGSASPTQMSTCFHSARSKTHKVSSSLLHAARS